MGEIEFHPLANVFPLIEGEQFRDLVEDIRTAGLRDPIVVYDGMILDGRNRYRACHAAQVAVRFETFRGKDPVGFVVSKNLRRRHLDSSQRSIIAAELAGESPGAGRPKNGRPASYHISSRRAARLLDVSKSSIVHAQRVVRRGSPLLKSAVKEGKLAVTTASEIARMPIEDQQSAITAESDLTRFAHSRRAERLSKLRIERAATGQSDHAVFKFFKVGHGRSLGDVRLGEITFLISSARLELAVLERLQSECGADANARIRDILSEQDVASIISKAKADARG